MTEDKNKAFLAELGFKFDDSFKDLNKKLEEINKALERTRDIGKEIDSLTFANDLDKAFQSLQKAVEKINSTSNKTLKTVKTNLNETEKAVQNLIHSFKIEDIDPFSFLDKAKDYRSNETLFKDLRQTTQRQLVSAIKSAQKEIDNLEKRETKVVEKEIQEINNLAKEYLKLRDIKKISTQDFIKKTDVFLEKEWFDKLSPNLQKQLSKEVDQAKASLSVFNKINQQVEELIKKKELGEISNKDFLRDAQQYLEIQNKGALTYETHLKLNKEILNVRKEISKEEEKNTERINKAKEEASAFYQVNKKAIDLLNKRQLGEISNKDFIEQGSKFLELKNRGSLQDETLIKLNKELLKADKDRTRELNEHIKIKNKQIQQEQKLAEQTAKQLRIDTEKLYNAKINQIGKLANELDPLMGSKQGNSSVEDKIMNTLVYTTSFLGIQGFKAAMNDAIDTNKQFEEGLIDLSRTLTNFTQQDMQKFGQSAINMSKSFGIPLQEVQVAMTELARAGIENRDDLLTMTKTISTGINTTSIKDAAEMTGYLVSAIKQMNLEFSDSMQIIDSWNKLADSYAVQTNDFAEAVSRAGSASQLLGIDLDHLNAMVVVLGEATQASGHMVGTALRAIENRMLRPDTIKTLEELGIHVKKDEDHFYDFKTIMDQVNVKLNEFGENSIKANKIMDALGGSWRKNWVQILSNNWNEVEQIAKESMDSTGYSVEKNEKTMQSYAKQVEVLKNTIRELYIAIGQEGGVLEQLKLITQQGVNVVEFFNSLSPAMKHNITLALELGVAYKLLSTAVKAITGRNMTNWIRESIPLLKKNTDVLNAYTVAQKTLEQVTKKYNLSAADQKAILDLVINKLGLAKVSTDGLTASQTVLTATTKELMKAKLLLNGVIATAIVGITALISKIKEHREKQKTLVQDTLSQLDAQESEYKTIESLIDEYEELSKKNNLTVEEKKRLLEITNKLIDTIPDASKVIRDETKSFTEQAEELKKLNAAKQLFEIDQLIDKDFDKKFDKTIKKIKKKESELFNYEDVYNQIKDLGGAWDGYAESAYSLIRKTKGELLETKTDVLSMASVLKAQGELMATVLGIPDEGKQLISQHIDDLVESNTGINEIKESTQQFISDLQEISQAKAYQNLQETMKNFNSETDHSLQSLKQQKAIISKISQEAKENLPEKQFKIFNDIIKKTTNSLDKLTEEAKNFEQQKQQMVAGNINLKKVLDDLNNKKMINADAQKRLIEAYPDLIKYMGDEKELAAQINRILYEQSVERDANSENYQEYAKQYDEATKRAQELTAILHELNTKHKLSAETLSTIVANYPQLIGCLDNEKVLREKLIELTDVQQRVQREAYNNMLMYSNTYFNELKKGNADLWNTIADGYGADAENFYRLIDIKNRMDQDFVALVGQRWASLHGLSISSLQQQSRAMNVQSRLYYDNPEAQKEISRRQTEINRLLKIKAAYDALANKAKTDVTKIPFKKINVGKIKENKPRKEKNREEKKEKEVYIPQVDRYRDLNAEIDKMNYLLQLNDTLQNKVNSSKRINVLNQRINQYRDLEKAYKRLNNERVRERNEIAQLLRKQGFQINQEGKIINYHSRLKQLTGDTAKEAEKLIQRYDSLTDSIIDTNITIEQNINEMHQLSLQMQELAREVAQSLDETHKASVEHFQNQLSLIGNIDTLEEVNKQIKILTDLRKEYEKQLKIIESSINKANEQLGKIHDTNQRKAIQAFIEELNKQKIEILIDFVANEDSIYQAQKQAQSMIQEKTDDRINTLKEMESKVIALIRKRYETEQKLINENHKKAIDSLNEQKKAFQDLINERIRLLEEEEDKEDYQKRLKELYTEKLELQKKYDILLADSSEESTATRMELIDSINKKQEEIDEYQHKHSVELRKKNLKDIIDNNNKTVEDKIKKMEKENTEYNKMLEERLRNDNLYIEAKRVLMEGFFQDANGQIIELSQALIEYEQRWGEGMSSVGSMIQKELIDKLKTAQEALINLGDLLTQLEKYKNVDNEDKGFIPHLPDTSKGSSVGVPKEVNDMFASAPNVTVPNPSVNTSAPKESSSKPKKSPSKPNVSSVVRTLKRGVRGEDVKRLQQALNQLVGAKLAIDGIFGSRTQAAVKTFQSRSGIASDGIVGKNTKAQFKKRGYKTGGVNDTLGLFALHGERQRVETIFNAEQGKKLFNLINSLPQEFLVGIPKFQSPKVNSDTIVPIQVDKLINIEGNADEKTIPQIQIAGENAIKKLQKAMYKQGRF